MLIVGGESAIDTTLLDQHILLAEDDPVFAELLGRYLVEAGCSVDIVGDSFAALRSFERHRPHLVLLDRMLPGIDGVEVCRRIRLASAAPVIILTAMGQQTDRIAGLEAGADDYVTKPVAPREIVLRVRALLRRSTVESLPATVVAVGRFSTHAATSTCCEFERPLPLTVREYELFSFLLRRPDHVFGRDELMRGAWGWAHGDRSSIAVVVRRIREKIERDSREPTILRTVWGRGYLLDSEGAA